MSAESDWLQFKEDPISYIQERDYDPSALPNVLNGLCLAVFTRWALQDSSLAYLYRNQKGIDVDEVFHLMCAKDPEKFKQWLFNEANPDEESMQAKPLLDLLYEEDSLESFFKREEVIPYRTDIDFVLVACVRYGLRDSNFNLVPQEKGLEANRFIVSALVNPAYFSELAFKNRMNEIVDGFLFENFSFIEAGSPVEESREDSVDNTEIDSAPTPDTSTNLTLEDILNDPNL